MNASRRVLAAVPYSGSNDSIFVRDMVVRD